MNETKTLFVLWQPLSVLFVRRWKLEPADSPEPAPHPAREEEHCRGENLFQVSLAQLIRIAIPVRLKDSPAGVRNETLKCEDDHTLVWMKPEVAVTRLRHDAHAWAVAAWLRLRARG